MGAKPQIGRSFTHVALRYIYVIERAPFVSLAWKKVANRTRNLCRGILVRYLSNVRLAIIASAIAYPADTRLSFTTVPKQRQRFSFHPRPIRPCRHPNNYRFDDTSSVYLDTPQTERAILRTHSIGETRRLFSIYTSGKSQI